MTGKTCGTNHVVPDRGVRRAEAKGVRKRPVCRVYAAAHGNGGMVWVLENCGERGGYPMAARVIGVAGDGRFEVVSKLAGGFGALESQLFLLLGRDAI